MEVSIREARPDDAEQLIAFVQRLAEEPGVNTSLGPGEFTFTVEEEREYLERFAASDNSIFLVAEVDGQIVGTLGVQGGKRKATRHVVTLGITVAMEWRNRGIGTSLMSRAIEWAKGTGIVKRIELFVFARNAPAIRLYEKFGFEVEGRRRHAVFRDGKYLDDLIMALLL